MCVPQEETETRLSLARKTKNRLRTRKYPQVIFVGESGKHALLEYARMASRRLEKSENFSEITQRKDFVLV